MADYVVAAEAHATGGNCRFAASCRHLESGRREIKPKRKIVDHSATRDALIDAAEELLREGGYAAVSSRRIGAKAGVQGPLIHYYFGTLDDLYLAVFRRITEAGMRRVDEILASDRPLHALWDLARDPQRARLTTELMALANHRTAIRDEIVQVAAETRRCQIESITRHLESKGKGIASAFPVAAIPVIMSSVSYLLSLETGLGISVGHAETEAVIGSFIDSLEGNATTPITAG